jgi:beta-glucosidase
MFAPAASDAHRSVALDTIVDSAVLLKNSRDALPLSSAWQKIAFVGKYCDQYLDYSYKQGSVYSGGGSGYVNTRSVVTPFGALRERLQGKAEVTKHDDAKGAEGADVALVCVSAHAEEGWDRLSLEMPDAANFVQDLRKQPGGETQKIVVLAIAPGAVTTEWVEETDATLLFFMPGEQFGKAAAHLLTGEAGPAGRLPVTFPRPEEKRFTSDQYPGKCPPPHEWCEDLTANFSEGVLVGYRWNDAKGIPAAFPFGFGLAYTSFHYSNFEARCLRGGRAEVSFTIANNGSRAGAAVPQLYVSFPSMWPAVRQLRRFEKVQVPSGGSIEVVFHLDEVDWSFYDTQAKKWTSAVAVGERVTVAVGSSSAHLLWNHTFGASPAVSDETVAARVLLSRPQQSSDDLQICDSEGMYV